METGAGGTYMNGTLTGRRHSIPAGRDAGRGADRRQRLVTARFRDSHRRRFRVSHGQGAFGG